MGRYLNPSEQGEMVQSLPPPCAFPYTPPRQVRPKQAQRRLRSEQIEELVVAYQAGATVYELADRFKIHRQTVSDLLKRRSVPRRLAPLTREQISEAIALYSSGLSLVAVADCLGCHHATVWRALRKAGVALRPRNGWIYT